MPRLARLDAPGVLQHVIARGIERREIFADEKDRQSFLDRLGDILTETKTQCFAWVLIPNHIHLLLRTGSTPLSRVMKRLLTGHAVYFNKRHQRSGHLFQNRYKSTICEEDPYLLELVRYIHLNPLRARIVKDLMELDRYPWSGHSAIMGLNKNDWQEVEEVLLHFSGKEAKARRNYRRFLQDGVEHGSRLDLIESRVSQLESKEDSDSRILGNRGFIERVLRNANEMGRPREKKGRIPLGDLLKRVSQTLKVDRGDLCSGDRRSLVSKARSVISYVAVREMGYSGVDVGRLLNLSGAAVTKSAEKGKRIISADESLRRKLIS
jgi:putative transposase